MSKVEHMDDSELFADIRELCIFCAKGIVIIANRHNQHPRLISKLFIEVYQKIIEDMEKSK